MCVILLCEEKRPSENWVERAWERNSDGGGIAWRDGGYIRWKKGLDEGAMQDFAKTLPFPFVLHFRVRSQGIIHPSLCHPFPVTKDASTQLSGKIKGGSVLFHNGTWGDWRKNCLEATYRRDVAIPDGLWMDSRAMAWLAGIYGTGILEFINEKAVVLNADPAKKPNLYGYGWIDKGDGIVMSNDLFLNGVQKWKQQHDAKTTVIGAGESGGTPHQTGFQVRDLRRSGSAPPTGHVVSTKVQEGDEADARGNHEAGYAGGGTEHPIEAAHRVLSDPRLELIGKKDTTIIYPSTQAVTEAEERNKRLEAHRKGVVSQERVRRQDFSNRGITLLGRY